MSYVPNEGKNVLIDGFSKAYGYYLSILSLIDSSKKSLAAIAYIMHMSVGGILVEMGSEFSNIRKN